MTKKTTKRKATAKPKAKRAARRRNIAPAIFAAGAASGIGSYLGTKHGMKSRKNAKKTATKRKKNLFGFGKKKKPQKFDRSRRQFMRSYFLGGSKSKAASAHRSPTRTAAKVPSSGVLADVTSALRNLGYSKQEASSRVKLGAQRGSDFDSIFRASLGKNPYKGLSKASRKRVSAKIAKLRREEVKPRQAVATALSMARAKRLGPKGGYRRRGRRNPEASGDISQAAKLYRKFHGRTPKEVIEIERVIKDQTYSGLGKLVSFNLLDGRQITWSKAEQPLLAADPQGRQLYAIGGNQDLGLNGRRDLMDLGPIVQVEYFTQKSFDNFEPIIYFHKFGEDDERQGAKPRRPRLEYDAANKQVSIVGGAYKIKGVGIVN